MTKWLFMASNNEGAENVWDFHVIECDYDKALEYCMAKAKKYIAEEEPYEAPEDNEFYPLDRGDFYGGFYIQYSDHHVAFFVVQFEEIAGVSAVSGRPVQDVIDEAETEYQNWLAENGAGEDDESA